ncbi:hypothetical protein KAR91_17230 [Candidatus Pacearchaeota archaeon]|nr:hypothetical protein [Candidatus Pacearchaeota archaeon]
MAFFKGQATDYQDMMDVLKNLAKDDHISVADIYNGGTGYAVGDTITLAGGTKYHEPELEVRGISSGDYITVAAVNAGGSTYSVGDSLVPTTGTYSVAPELEVLTESGGAVTSILIKNPGICSAQPSNPVATTSDGSGTGCTIDFTFAAGTGIITAVHIADAGVYTATASNPVLQNTSSGSGTGAKFEVTYVDTAWETLLDFEAYEATVAVISAAGTGYSANDIVTIVGGSFVEAATVKVLTVSGGVPQTVEVNSGGEYISTPSNPASSTNGNGSGLTLTMTWAYTVAEHKYLMLHNTTTDQYVGWKSLKETSPETAYLLQCNGFSGFNSVSTPWDQQPGAVTADSDREDNYVPLSGGGTPATVYYWISIDDERITAAFKVASVYPNMYLGAPDKFLTANEWGYPQLILGCLARKSPYTYAGDDFAGMNNPGVFLAEQSQYGGPGWLRKPDGTFTQVANWEIISGNPTYLDNHDVIQIAPAGGTEYTPPAIPNSWYSNTNNWRELFTEKTIIAAGQDELKRINDDFMLIPCTLASDVDVRIFGSMRGIFALSPDGAINSEDRIYIGSDVYRCFQNCNKSNRNYFFALKEN